MGEIPVGAYSDRHAAKDLSSYDLAQRSFADSSIALLDKLEAFPRFSTKRSIARFLAKTEIYKKIVGTTGVIIECGVFNGAGLFTWAQLSNIFEPVNYTRKVIGFDTFSGFPSVNEQADNSGVLVSKAGDLCGSPMSEILASVDKLDSERALSHIPLVSLIPGDVAETVPEFIERNAHTIDSLLYLDFDLYEPTRIALETFLPRMPKGAIVAFDEINCESFPGETRALDEVMGIGNCQIRRFPFDPWVSYIQL